MKTLKFFLLVLVFVVATNFAPAYAGRIASENVDNVPKLTNTLKSIVQSDFKQLDNFFDQNNIDEMNETVKLTFYVTKEKKLQVLSSECNNEKASVYLKQLLDNRKINVSEEILQRKFKLNVKLIYKS